MTAEFLNYISNNRLFEREEKILLGVSGGIDSMVMTHLFMKAGFSFGMAHCNFRLRGEESDKDEDLVKEFAAARNIPFYLQRFDTKDFAAQNGISVQMAARELRYEWFEKTRQEGAFKSIAVAHNLNDQVETVILNLVRGTGITGLSGMKPSSGNIIRPLLFATREEIEEYCITYQIPFREDRSNLETRYTRNKIRHKIIPLLKEINPSVEHTIAETSHRLAGTDEIAGEYINDLRRKLSREDGNRIIFDIGSLTTFSTNHTILFELFAPYGLTGKLTNDLLNVIKGRSGGQILTSTHRIIKDRKELLVSQIEKKSERSFEIVNPDAFNGIPFVVSFRILYSEQGFRPGPEKNIAHIDFERLRFPLIIRPWRKGDTFYPLGMDHRKKLSDYFTDTRIPLRRKEKMMILESSGDIVWLIGERLDNRFRIIPETKSILKIEVAPD